MSYRIGLSLMTCHLTLFLACFSVITADRGVLEQLSMVFRIFVIFYILSHVILRFSQNIAIIWCFYVIQEEIIQIGKTKHLKTCEYFRKTINKYSRGL